MLTSSAWTLPLPRWEPPAGYTRARGAVAHLVVGSFLRHARHHPKRWLGSGQRLHLRLLIHTVDNGRLGRVQLEADDVVDLLHELRIVGEREPILALRFQLECFPDFSDRGLRQAAAVGHLLPRPVGRVLRCRRQRCHDDPLGRYRCRAPRARLVDQPIQPRFQEACTPPADRVRRAARSLARSATVLLSRPSPQPSTNRDRNARACEDFARLSQRSNRSRSSSLRISSVFGHPVLGLPTFITQPENFRRTTVAAVLAGGLPPPPA